MDTSERRRDLRARIALPTCLLRRGDEEPLQMIDASFRGLFVATDRPPAIRSLVRLRIKLPNRVLETHGVCVRVVKDALGRTGVGLRFFALTGQDRADWESFISTVIHQQQVPRARAA